MTTTKEMTTDEIYAELKINIRDFAKQNGLKISVTKNHFNSFSIALMSSKELLTEVAYSQLNPNFIEDSEELTEKGREIFMELNKIASARRVDNSDYHTDYHNVNFYYSLNIGKYNKPYNAFCDTTDLTLTEAQAMNLDLSKLLKRNQKLSYDNRRAIENYIKLKNMFTA